jgi:hypothetical protein
LIAATLRPAISNHVQQNSMRQSFGVCGNVFSVPIDYAARRAAGQKAYTSLKHGMYLFHYHQMRFIVRAAAT